MGSKIGGCFRVRFSEITGGISLVFRVFRLFSGPSDLLDRFRRGRNFFGAGRAGLGNNWTRATTTATPATATAIAAGAGCGCGRFQIGMFVRHKF